MAHQGNVVTCIGAFFCPCSIGDLIFFAGRISQCDPEHYVVRPAGVSAAGEAGSGGKPRTTNIRHICNSRSQLCCFYACVCCLCIFEVSLRIIRVTQQNNDARPVAGATAAPERAKMVGLRLQV